MHSIPVYNYLGGALRLAFNGANNGGTILLLNTPAGQTQISIKDGATAAEMINRGIAAGLGAVKIFDAINVLAI